MAHQPNQNRLLAALPHAELQLLLPNLRERVVATGEIIAEAGQALEDLLFPVDAVLSLSYLMQSGEATGITLIGNEGVLGGGRLPGGEALPYRVNVEVGGHLYSLSANALEGMNGHLLGMQRVMRLYPQALLTQMAQAIVCEKHHSLQQRLCKHLLLICDKSNSNDFHMTHEAISNMLGVRRESITEAAGELREKGLINYSRGHIHVLNRAMLEKLCCECYGVVQQEFERLLGKTG